MQLLSAVVDVNGALVLPVGVSGEGARHEILPVEILVILEPVDDASEPATKRQNVGSWWARPPGTVRIESNALR